MKLTTVTVPRFLPVSHWPRYFDWPSPAGLQRLIRDAQSNGFAPAVKRLGNRVLINCEAFWQIVENDEGLLKQRSDAARRDVWRGQGDHVADPEVVS